jgi:hypothetical protein
MWMCDRIITIVGKTEQSETQKKMYVATMFSKFHTFLRPLSSLQLKLSNEEIFDLIEWSFYTV